MNRKGFLYKSIMGGSVLLNVQLFHSKDEVVSPSKPFRVHQWQRDTNNPIFPPGGGWYDVSACMNPFIVMNDQQYFLFYAGADKKGIRRICLATSSLNNHTTWKRYGPILDVGKKDAFDEKWCVLPCVIQIDNKWHLYYTGRAAYGEGLQSFRGIGLATSDDLINWEKWSEDPILLGDGFPEWKNNHGIAGGGSIVKLPKSDGGYLYRMYYTLTTGTPSKNLIVDQAKQSVVAHSYDGISWSDRRVVLRPRQYADYEDAANTGLRVWKNKSGWRAIYSAIGTKFGAYSICEATSNDGLNWYRGEPGENLSLSPGESSWENEMVEYPFIIDEGDSIRLFYCGNGYGRTGIGTAVAEKI